MKLGSRRLNADHHSGDISWLDFFSEAERELFREGVGIDKCAKHPIPEGERCAEIFADFVRGRMMDTVVVGRNENPFEGTNVYLQIGMFPKLDAEPEGIADGGFKRSEVKNCDRDDHLRDIVDKRVEQARAKTGEPVEMFGRMVPGVGSPENGEAMLGPMQPVNDEIDHQDGEANSHGQWQFFQIGGNGRNQTDMAARITRDYAGANAIGDNGEDK